MDLELRHRETLGGLETEGEEKGGKRTRRF